MNKCVLPVLLACASLTSADRVFAETAVTNAVAVEGAATGEIWTLERFQREFCGEDSWEPFNRTMFGIFDWCMEYAVDPFCYLYSSIVPKPLIKGIDNFSENLEEPVRIFSNLFMGEWRPAWDATRRFCVNSTVGIGGLFDPAANCFGIADSGASMSDTLARWGVPSGPLLALPFVPRSSVRGHVGYAIDYAFDLKTWIDFCVPSEIYVGYSWFLVPNYAPVWRGDWADMFYHAEDRYAVYMPVVSALNDFNLRQFAWRRYEEQFGRAQALAQARQFDEGSAEREKAEARAESFVNDVRPPVRASATRPDGLLGEWREIPGYAPRGPSLDSLRALCFSPLGDDDFWWERRSVFNRDFSKSIEARKVVISNDLPKAVYSFVAQRQPEDGAKLPERLAVVFPGIGAGRTASEVVAMAEFLNRNGFAVVMVDSLFHWEHVRSVNCGILPGYLTEDMKRFAVYLGKIVDDLRSDGRIDRPEISLLGWSMGGVTTAFMAALDDAGRLPIKVARFVAINPPASVAHSLSAFASVLESSRNWSKEDARKMFTETATSLYGWAAQDHPRYDPDDRPVDPFGNPWDYAPNLTEEQANFLLGQTVRIIFPTLVAQRHRIAPFPWIKSELTWSRRRDFYREVGGMSMEDYIRKFVPACYEGVSGDDLVSAFDIRRLESTLTGNMRFSVIHTWNDPLQDDADRLYFDRILRKRITWFADGGHCGYFYTKPFERELLRHLDGQGVR